MKIELASSELIQAGIAGVMRTTKAISKDYSNKFGNGARNFDSEIIGCMAEMAVCKYLGVFWSNITTADLVDAGDYQVRATRYHSGALILYKTDNPDHVFILCTVKEKTITIIGGISGSDGMRDEFWRKDGVKLPSWWVPQDKLTPIKELHRYQESQRVATLSQEKNIPLFSN